MRRLQWVIFALVSLVFSHLLSLEPIAVYTTWLNDPSSTMTICMIDKEGESLEKSLVYHRIEDSQWFSISNKGKKFPDSYPYNLNVIELQDLAANQIYEFTFEGSATLYRFQTLPNQLTRAVKWIEGGDIYHDSIEYVVTMNTMAAKLDPDFAVLGGDIAYAGSKFFFLSDHVDRWIDFLRIWSKTMIRSDGVRIPLVPILGNHDVNGRFDQGPESAAWAHFLFPSIREGYQTLSAGDYLTLFLLDSGHTNSISGKQKEWLRKSLEKYKDQKYRFAIYHVPAYPSVRLFNNEKSEALRRHWTPLFDKYPITAAFEHHDHAYKRTIPIRYDKPDPQGVIYLGDGAWGVEKPRYPRAKKKSWYLEVTKPLRHVILITLNQEHAKFEALNDRGEVFDSFTR